MSEPLACGTCGTVDDPADVKTETRPYGPGGEPICFDCAMATPETATRTEQAFMAIVNASVAATGSYEIEPGLIVTDVPETPDA